MNEWRPDIVIYHAPCDDGFAAAWACWRRWGDDVAYHPAKYGAPAPDVAGKRILIVDFSFKRTDMDELARSAASIVVLDHHKTAEAELEPFRFRESEPGVIGPEHISGMLRDLAELRRPPVIAIFDMHRSGARMAWDFCFADTPPELIQFVQDRDLWLFRYPETKAFSLYLRSHEYAFATWSRIADELGSDRKSLMTAAHALQAFYDQKVAEMVREVRIELIAGHSVPVVNTSWAFASDVAHELLRLHPAAPFAACYYDRGDGTRTYSLRSDDARLDVSEIARRFGGGGHRNAAGFETPRL